MEKCGAQAQKNRLTLNTGPSALRLCVPPGSLTRPSFAIVSVHTESSTKYDLRGDTATREGGASLLLLWDQ